MKIYGLFKVINKNNTQYNSIDLFNALHPNKKIIDIDLFDNDPKTFFNFFYEDNPAILKADIDIQYIEYNKFKKELEMMVNRKTISQYERDITAKMLQRVITAENKFTKYVKEVEKQDKIEDDNQKIIDLLYDSQSKFAKNIQKFLNMYIDFVELNVNSEIPNELKLLFDANQISSEKYEDTIMYPSSIISFYRTGINHSTNKISLDKNEGRIEYIVFELDENESVLIKKTESTQDKINKLETIIKLCDELSLLVPEYVIDELHNILKCINYKYDGKDLMIFPINENYNEIEYEIIHKI